MEIKNDLLNENIIITADVEKAFSYAVYHTDARLKVENYARDTMFSFIHFILFSNQTNTLTIISKPIKIKTISIFINTSRY